MSPVEVLANWANVACDRSMTRPGLSASRSSTVHCTDVPVDRSVTVTTVPKARSGLAQVPAGAPYQEACPVVLGWDGGGAVVVGAGVVVGGGGGGAGLGATVVVGAGGGEVVEDDPVDDAVVPGGVPVEDPVGGGPDASGAGAVVVEASVWAKATVTVFTAWLGVGTVVEDVEGRVAECGVCRS